MALFHRRVLLCTKCCRNDDSIIEKRMEIFVLLLPVRPRPSSIGSEGFEETRRRRSYEQITIRDLLS